jgi:hypothetical protein
MKWNDHSELAGLHAPFPASQSAWLRYDDEKIIDKYLTRNRKRSGSELHEYAESQINLSQKVTSIKQLINDVCTYVYAKYKEREELSYGLSVIKDIKLLPRHVFETLKLYINDAIGFKMKPEVVLLYSLKSFGTADTISFRNMELRIHDFKSGDIPAHMEQLLVYAALFCLEYKIKPGDLELCELRIYQREEVIVHNPEADEILPIMDRIVTINKLIDKVDEEV